MSPSTSTPPVLAGPPGDFCFKGVKHSGGICGQTITIADIETYKSELPAVSSPGRRNVILFFSDVFGPFYLNAQLLQDYFASFGFIVLGVDYFLGDPVHLHTAEPGFDRDGWMKKSRKQAIEIVPKWIAAVREIYGQDAQYCSVGYCFGGPFALDLATTDNIVASAFAHPALIDEDHFKKLTKPLLMSCAEVDHTFPTASRRRAEDILVEIKATYHIQVFSGVSHGFATRGDSEVENTRWAKEECARSVINWFTRFTSIQR